MKKFLSLVIIVLALCSVFSAVAYMADDGGIKFGANSYCPIASDLADQPVTVEATVRFNKRAIYKNESVLFGNDRTANEQKSFTTFFITKDGNPGVKWNDTSDFTRSSVTFDQVYLITSQWVHLAIVMDNAKSEAKCYINGELAQTRKYEEKFEIWLDKFAVGGDSSLLNQKPFLGEMKNFAVYSDVRTEAEIKKDMEKQGKEDLILHYDFTDITEERPIKVNDLSSYKNDLILGRIWIDEPAKPANNYAYSFAVIGDTQNMAKNYTENFKEIYNWVYDNIESRNIEMVIGMGDIVNDNYDYEWAAAAEVFDIIDGYVPHIPIRGNHDNLYWYNKTVSQLEYAKMVDGTYKDGDYASTYVEMDIGGIPYLFLQLNYVLDDDILGWACDVVESHPNHNVIVSRHNHLWDNGKTLNQSQEVKSGIAPDALWDRFLSQYENIVLMLSGHVSNDIVLTTQRKGVHGNTVTEMLIDFQSVDNAANSFEHSRGAGNVVMFHFSEDGRKVQMEVYSTVAGQYFYDANQREFELDLVSDTKYVKSEKSPIPPRGEAKSTEIKMTIDSLTAFVNGETKTLDAAPIIRNSRTMLPVRFVAENLGATVGWDDVTKTVTVKSADTTIEIVIGASTAKVNGAEIALDSPAFIENSRTYLPVRVVAENLGATVGWDDATKTATLTK
ncbi:MAG: metallophosphoesterase [Clostridia bacterium]|nr:metallophosphoesterase [Clostridia bacterium]